MNHEEHARMKMAAKLSMVTTFSIQDAYSLLKQLEWNEANAKLILGYASKWNVAPAILLDALRRMGAAI